MICNAPPFSNEEFEARDVANSKNGFILAVAWDKETFGAINRTWRARDVSADPGARKEYPPHPASEREGETCINSVKSSPRTGDGPVLELLMVVAKKLTIKGTDGRVL